MAVKKPYIHWDTAVNAHLHVRHGSGPLVLDAAENLEDLRLLATKYCADNIWNDRYADYIQRVHAVVGSGAYRGLRVGQYEYMPDGMAFFIENPATGEPIPHSVSDPSPPPFSQTLRYIQHGNRLSLRGFVGTAVGSGYAADVKLTWADTIQRSAGDVRGAYTGLLLRPIWALPGFLPWSAHCFSLLHGKRTADFDWVYSSGLWLLGSPPPIATSVVNDIADDTLRIIAAGGLNNTIKWNRLVAGVWEQLRIDSVDLGQFIPPINPEYYNHIALCADLFAGSVRVQPASPLSWQEFETWFKLIEMTQYEPWVLDISSWGYSEWEDYWSWLYGTGLPSYPVERRLPSLDLVHQPLGARGAPTYLRTSDEELGACVQFNDRTYLVAMKQWDATGFSNTSLLKMVPTDDGWLGYRAPLAMFGRFKFRNMSAWSQTEPVDIMSAGAPGTTNPASANAFSLYWVYTGGFGRGTLVLEAWDFVAAAFVYVAHEFNAEDWDDVPVDMGFAWSGARGDTVGRPSYELRIVINGQTVSSIVNRDIKLLDTRQIFIGSDHGARYPAGGRKSFSGFFRGAQCFVDAMSDSDIRGIWFDAQALDNPSFEVAGVRPGEAEGWTWNSQQTVGGWAGFNEYHERLLAWATAYELFGAGYHQPHTWSYADEAERLAEIGFAPVDVGGIAWQRDDDSLWMLIADSPISWLEMVLPTNEEWSQELTLAISTVFNEMAVLYRSQQEIFALWDFTYEQGGTPYVGVPWLTSHTWTDPAHYLYGPLGAPVGLHGWKAEITGVVDHPLEIEAFGEGWDTDPFTTLFGNLWLSGNTVNGGLRGQPLSFPLRIVPDRKYLTIYSDESKIFRLELSVGEYADAASLSAMCEGLWQAAAGSATGVEFSSWNDGVQSGLTFGWNGSNTTHYSWMGMFGTNRSARYNDARKDIGLVFGADDFGHIEVPVSEISQYPLGTDADEVFLLDQWSLLLFDTMIDPYIPSIFTLDNQAAPVIFGAFDEIPDTTVIEIFTLHGWFGAAADWIYSLPDNPPSIPGPPWAKFDGGSTKWEYFVDSLWPDNLF